MGRAPQGPSRHLRGRGPRCRRRRARSSAPAGADCRSRPGSEWPLGRGRPAWGCLRARAGVGTGGEPTRAAAAKPHCRGPRRRTKGVRAAHAGRAEAKPRFVRIQGGGEKHAAQQQQQQPHQGHVKAHPQACKNQGRGWFAAERRTRTINGDRRTTHTTRVQPEAHTRAYAAPTPRKNTPAARQRGRERETKGEYRPLGNVTRRQAPSPLALTEFSGRHGHVMPGQHLPVKRHRGENRPVLGVDAEVALRVCVRQDGVSRRWGGGT